MSKAHPPELKRYMDKKITFKLNGKRVVTGILRGFDPFMNLVVDESVEIRKDKSQKFLGIVIFWKDLNNLCVICEKGVRLTRDTLNELPFYRELLNCMGYQRKQYRHNGSNGKGVATSSVIILNPMDRIFICTYVHQYISFLLKY